MKATKLIVTATEYTEYDDKETSYDFPVYQFSNGLIMVIGEDTNDWFFEDRGSIEANGPHGLAQVTNVEIEAESTIDWSLKDLRKAIRASLGEFGSIPPKALAMLG